MFEKIHRWSDEETVELDIPEKPEREPVERDDFELEELIGHRVRDITSDDD